MYQVGKVTVLVGRFTDASGNPVDPTTVTVTITAPDGTPSTQAATKATTGVWEYTYTPGVPGQYQYVFTGTGANASVTSVDAFTVGPATTGALISLDQAKKQLNKVSNADDDEILGYIQSASNTVTAIAGASVPTVYTETIDARMVPWGHLGYRRTALPLNHSPIIEVTDIHDEYQTLSTDDIAAATINSDAGIVYLHYRWFHGPVSVTYTAGRTQVPPVLQTACALIVKWLWESRRGGSTKTPDEGGDEVILIKGIPVPSRAAALLLGSGYETGPSIA